MGILQRNLAVQESMSRSLSRARAPRTLTPLQGDIVSQDLAHLCTHQIGRRWSASLHGVGSYRSPKHQGVHGLCKVKLSLHACALVVLPI